MESHQFDELTRNLTTTISRRNALKLLLTSIASYLLLAFQQCGELGETCKHHSDCCSGQCIGTFFPPHSEFRKRCVPRCNPNCTEAPDVVKLLCKPGHVICMGGVPDKVKACCRNGFWYECGWDPGTCSGCIGGRIIEPIGDEKCCNGRIATWDPERYRTLGTPNLSGSGVPMKLLTRCQDCDGNQTRILSDGEQGKCSHGEFCCGGECATISPCQVCENGRVIRKPDTTPCNVTNTWGQCCGGNCIECNPPRQFRHQDCKCLCPDCPQGLVPDPNSATCGCKCPDCPQGLVPDPNSATCECKCPDCPQGLVPDPNSTLCGCRCPDCPVNETLTDPNICRCDCLAPNSKCNGTCYPPCTQGARNPDNCECEECFGCRTQPVGIGICIDSDAGCDICEVCQEGVCVPRECPNGLTCCADECVDISSDPRHCGECENALLLGCYICENGKERSNDPSRCEDCDAYGRVFSTCGDNQICCNGQCQAADQSCCAPEQLPCNSQCCDKGQTCCNGQCQMADESCCTPLETPCGDQCCNEDQTCCNDTCVDTSSDPNHCLTCNSPCESGVCCNGLCCSSDLPNCCNGECVDLQSDNKNCGDCGRGCDPSLCCNGNCYTPACGGCCPPDTFCVACAYHWTKAVCCPRESVGSAGHTGGALCYSSALCSPE